MTVHEDTDEMILSLKAFAQLYRSEFKKKLNLQQLTDLLTEMKTDLEPFVHDIGQLITRSQHLSDSESDPNER